MPTQHTERRGLPSPCTTQALPGDGGEASTSINSCRVLDGICNMDPGIGHHLNRWRFTWGK